MGTDFNPNIGDLQQRKEALFQKIEGFPKQIFPEKNILLNKMTSLVNKIFNAISSSIGKQARAFKELKSLTNTVITNLGKLPEKNLTDDQKQARIDLIHLCIALEECTGNFLTNKNVQKSVIKLAEQRDKLRPDYDLRDLEKSLSGMTHLTKNFAKEVLTTNDKDTILKMLNILSDDKEPITNEYFEEMSSLNNEEINTILHNRLDKKREEGIKELLKGDITEKIIDQVFSTDNDSSISELYDTIIEQKGGNKNLIKYMKEKNDGRMIKKLLDDKSQPITNYTIDKVMSSNNYDLIQQLGNRIQDQNNNSELIKHLREKNQERIEAQEGD